LIQVNAQGRALCMLAGETGDDAFDRSPGGGPHAGRWRMPHFELSAHMTVRPGQLEGFKRQAAEIIRLARERDTATLRYDWFLTADGAECEVRELYTDPQGLIDHKAHIAPALHELFARYADNHFMTVYGEPSPALRELVHALHMERQVKWFTFVDGLGAPADRLVR
jgi:hypothetical protein